jgi:phosphatidate cytidylyltransferase
MNETIKRTISGIVYIALLIGSIYYSQTSFISLFGIFFLLSVYEFCKIMKINYILPILLAVGLYSLFFVFKTSSQQEIILALFAVVISTRCIFFLFNNQNTIPEVQKYLYLLGYVVLPVLIITKIPFVSGVYNPKIISSIFILIWTNDTFAYIVGKSIGKTKLLEHISPKKTVEGFLGGMIFTIIAGILIAVYYTYSLYIIWLFASIIIVFCSTIGDLVESKFKRIAGVKDSGKIMPGHGGILDRLDSVLFVAPFIYLFFKIFNYA